jgi:hypothetical protein
VTFILLLRELWHRKFLVVLVTILAAAAATAAVFSVSFSPPSLSKRDHSEAKGEVEILVDSNRSPIADVARNIEPLTARAGVFARYMAGGNVIKKISETTGIPVKEIEVAGPAPLPGEVIEAPTPLNLKPYGIAFVQRAELPIVNVETRAPTVEEARKLAAATPGAVSSMVAQIQEEQQIPVGKRVTFRVLGPAQGDLATEALGAKAAIAIFVVLEIIGLLLILGIPRLVRAWRSVDSGGPAAMSPQLEAIPRVAPEPEPPSVISAGNELAERAQLGMRRGAD